MYVKNENVDLIRGILMILLMGHLLTIHKWHDSNNCSDNRFAFVKYYYCNYNIAFH